MVHLLSLGSELGVASSGNYSFLHSSQKSGFAEEQGGLADFGSCVRQCRRRQDADFGLVLEAAADYWDINFSKECAALPFTGALLCMAHLLKNRCSPGAPQPPERQDGQDVLLPAETKQDLAQISPAKPAQSKLVVVSNQQLCWRQSKAIAKCQGLTPHHTGGATRMGVCSLCR